MQILGHELISYRPLYAIQNTNEIENISLDDTVLFEYDVDLIKFAQIKKVKFALHVFNEIDAIVGNGAGACILICPQRIASKVQNLAEYYLFDAKVAIMINNENEITQAIELKADMAILPDAII